MSLDTEQHLRETFLKIVTGALERKNISQEDYENLLLMPLSNLEHLETAYKELNKAILLTKMTELDNLLSMDILTDEKQQEAQAEYDRLLTELEKVRK
jgi:hypothetical protein